MNQRIEITQAEYNELVTEQEAGNYTQFYLRQYEMGSDISGLYVAGPTGYGVFGAYSLSVIKSWMTFYNTDRPHSALDRLPPSNAEPWLHPNWATQQR